MQSAGSWIKRLPDRELRFKVNDIPEPDRDQLDVAEVAVGVECPRLGDYMFVEADQSNSGKWLYVEIKNERGVSTQI